MADAHPSGSVPDVDAREAFLFLSADEEQYGVSLDRDGRYLPADTTWIFDHAFWLGVHEGVPAPIEPEPILRGLVARGYFTWPRHRTHPFSTNQ